MAERPDYIPTGSWAGLTGVLRALEHTAGVRRDPDRIDPAEVDQANDDMQRAGCLTRYRPDGSAYLLEGEE